MKNLEIKLRVDDLAVMEARARAGGATNAGTLRQVDTFYRAHRGLLKLRTLDGGGAELIAYERPRVAGSRESDYLIYPTEDPGRLQSILDRSLERMVQVRKHRSLWLFGGTRIHLDTVLGLGTFVELETEADSRPESEVRAEHATVIAGLELDPAASLPETYAEMLLGRPLEA